MCDCAYVTDNLLLLVLVLCSVLTSGKRFGCSLFPGQRIQLKGEESVKKGISKHIP